MKIKSLNKLKSDKNDDDNDNEDKKINLANNFFGAVGEKTEDKNFQKIFSKDVFSKSIKNKYISYANNEFSPIVNITGEAKIDNISSYVKNQKNLIENFNEIRDSWKFKVLQFFEKFPEEKIRNYFGEKVCLYYHFICFYSRYLCLITFIGVIVYILQMTDSYESMNIEIFSKQGIQKSRYIMVVNTFYTFFVIIWSTIFVEMWKRNQARYAAYWGMDDIENKQTILPTFKGKIRRSPYNDDMNEPYSSRWRFIVRQIFAYLISLTIVFFVILFVVLLLIYKNDITVNKLGGKYHEAYMQFPSKEGFFKFFLIL